jgi:hypothetical protein
LYWRESCDIDLYKTTSITPLQTIFLAALAILPAYKTAPIIALLREAYLPDPEVLLNRTIQRAAARYASLDARHTIALVTSNTGYRHETRLTMILQHSTHTDTSTRAYVYRDTSPTTTHAPESPPLDAREMHTPSPLQITIYSDGSQTGQGAGYGFAIYLSPILVIQGLGSAGPRTEVYDAELMGAVEGLRAAVNPPCTSYTTSVAILFNNLEKG